MVNKLLMVSDSCKGQLQAVPFDAKTVYDQS